jgi:acyl-coenzyme A synthetase/AMP-(fatty) acid ligase/3-hydroxymyristoyl/3-hydroxydecanoyl-(acyl carrier protein) dehydratase
LFEDDGVEFVAAVLGAWRVGCTVFLPGDTLPATEKALRQQVDAVIGPWAGPTVLAQARELAAPAADADTQPIDAAAAIVFFSSGSTGTPQPITKHPHQLLAEVDSLEAQFGARLGANSRVVSTVSHQHIYGFLFKLLWPLVHGREFEAASEFFPEALAEMLADRPCVLISSPAHLRRLPDQIDWSGARSQLRAVFCSGAPLSDEGVALAERLLGGTPIEVFGSTETGGIAWRTRAFGADADWTPLPGVAIDTARDDGLLAIRSAHLPDSAWFVLADRVAADGRGGFRLLGRADRIAKVEGRRVSLSAIERRLCESDAVTAARVCLLAAEVDSRRSRKRDEVAAVIVPSGSGWQLMAEHGKAELNRRLNAWLADSVVDVARPRRWRYVDQLPANAQGKTTDQLVQLLFDAPRATVPASYVLERGERHADLFLLIDAALAQFDGHFPQQTVCPGIAQVEWALLFARRWLALDGPFRRLENVKFQRVLAPGTVCRLRIELDPARQRLDFRLTSTAGPHASGRVVFGAGDS